MQRIMDARKREILWLRKVGHTLRPRSLRLTALQSKILSFFMTFFWDVIPLVVCVISLAFFVLVAHGELTVAIAFPTLQALSILTQSLTMVCFPIMPSSCSFVNQSVDSHACSIFGHLLRVVHSH